MAKKGMLHIYFMVVLAILFWGASFAGAKMALEQASPLLVMTLRFVLSLPVLGAAAFFMGEMKLPSAKQAAILASLGFFGFFFHLGIQTVAMQTSGTANANWQMTASPALTALLAALFLKEKINARGICGIITAFLGVALVLSLGTRGAGGLSAYNYGDFLITVSMLNWASFMVITRWLFSKEQYPPVFTLFWEMIFATLMCLPLLAATHTDISVVAGFRWQTWGALALLGFLCSGLAYLFWYIAAARIPVAKLMVFQFLQPLVGVLVGYFVIGERFTFWLFISGAMIIFGVWLVNTQPHAQDALNSHEK